MQDFDMGYLPPGNYIKEWGEIDVPAGTYVYSIFVNDEMIDDGKVVTGN